MTQNTLRQRPTLIANILISLLLIPAPAITASGTLYHWIDADGHPVYSDQPRYSQQSPVAAAKPITSQPSHYRIRLTSLQTPAPKQRIITLHTQPPLARQDKAALYLNNRRYQSPLHSRYFLLHKLPAGTHTLTVRILRQQKNIPVTSAPLKLMIR